MIERPGNKNRLGPYEIIAPLGAGGMGEVYHHMLPINGRPADVRPLIDAGWVVIRPGDYRREKLVRLTDAGAAKLREARSAWERAQERLRSRLPKEIWASLLDLLPELTRLAHIA